MNELEQALIGDSYAAPPRHILEGLTDDLVHRALPGVPRTLYAELWHICFWQEMSLGWIAGLETPYPAKATDPYPSEAQTAAEPWPELCERFDRTVQQAAALTRDPTKLDHRIRCTSRPGKPVRSMTVREQIESLAAHNAYHFGRFVLMRQLLGAWPPASGGFTW